MLNNMALSSCLLTSQPCFSIKVDRPIIWNTSCRSITSRICTTSSLESRKTSSLFGKQDVCLLRTSLIRNAEQRRSSAVHASWLSSSEIASGAFTLGTAAVLPIYTFMVVAPKAELTKKVVESSAPFAVLGALYAYLLYLSWTPDTIRLMFASKYWLPELPGIAKMFSSEMTLASAWIHLLAVDLFAARHVYSDGVVENVETRHSVSLCLLFCPVGIVSHFITKALTRHRRSNTEQELPDKRH